MVLEPTNSDLDPNSNNSPPEFIPPETLEQPPPLDPSMRVFAVAAADQLQTAGDLLQQRRDLFQPPDLQPRDPAARDPAARDLSSRLQPVDHQRPTAADYLPPRATSSRRQSPTEGTTSAAAHPLGTDVDFSGLPSQYNPLYIPPITKLNNAHHSISIKLNPNNYLLWSTQLSFFLKGQGLFGYVSGRKPPPPIYSPDYELWEQQDAAIISCLFSSLSESVQPQAIGKPTSFAIWESLKNTYSTPSTSRTMYLRDQLYDLRQGDLSISEFLNKAKLLNDELAAIDKAPSYDELLGLILSHLRDELLPMKTSIMARKPQPDLEEVTSLLLSAEAMHARSLRSVPPAPPSDFPHAAAHYVHRGGPPLASHSSPAEEDPSRFQRSSHRSGAGSSRFSSNRGRNQSRNNRGRWSQQSSSRFQQRDSRISCQLCGQRDHLATACPRFLQSAPVAHSVTSRVPSMVDSAWYPDTGASHHVTPDLSQLQLHDDYSGSDKLRVADGTGKPVKHVGSSAVLSNSGIVHLNHILHVPSVTKSLLSVSRFCLDNNAHFVFTDSGFVVKDNTSHRVLLSGTTHRGLYLLHPPVSHVHRPVSSSSPVSSSPTNVCRSPSQALSAEVSPSVWHHRLGHPNVAVLRKVLGGFPLGRDRSFSFKCTSCPLGKLCRQSFPLSDNRSSHVLDLLFMDVWGPSPHISSVGSRYYLSIVDDYSRYVWIYCCATKSAVFSLFTAFQKMAERQFGVPIKSVQTDGGGVSLWPLCLIFVLVVLYTGFLARILIIRWVGLSVVIVRLLMLASLSLLILVLPFVTGSMRSRLLFT